MVDATYWGIWRRWCLQPLRSAVAVEEALFELASGGPDARIDFTTFLQPDLCETEHDPAEQAQRKGSLGVADPALILTQRHVQGVTQAVLDNPVAPLEFEKADGIQL